MSDFGVWFETGNEAVEPMMTSRDKLFAMSPGTILSPLAAFPALVPAPALAQTGTELLPSWNDTATKKAGRKGAVSA